MPLDVTSALKNHRYWGAGALAISRFVFKYHGIVRPLAVESPPLAKLERPLAER